MIALLMELQRGRTRAGLKAVAFVLLAAVALGAAAAGFDHWTVAQQVAACEAEGGSIAEVWNEDVKAKLRDALLATGVSYAEPTAENVMLYFQAQADAWRTARTEVCLLLGTRDDVDAGVLEQSYWCLDERRIEFEALVLELLQVNKESVEDAVTAASELSEVGLCRQPHRLRHLPKLPQSLSGVKSLLPRVSRVNALMAVGKYGEGLTEAQHALADAEKLGWAPLTATIRLQAGILLEELGKYDDAEISLEAAYFQAARAGAMEVATDAAASLARVVGCQQERHEEALRWTRHADIALESVGAGEENYRRVGILNDMALAYECRGAYEEARVILERVLAIARNKLGLRHPYVAVHLHNLANVDQSAGRYADAKRGYQSSLGLLSQALGAEHPDVAHVLHNLSQAHYSLGEYEEALRRSEQALSIRERNLGPDHPEVADSLHVLGVIHSAAGAYERAKAAQSRALKIRERCLGEKHPSVAQTLAGLGLANYALRVYNEARPQLARAAEILERAFGPDHIDFARAINNLGLIHVAMGRYGEAKRMLARALGIRQRVFGVEHRDVAQSLHNLGFLQMKMRSFAEAKSLLDRALYILEKVERPNHPDTAATLNCLASIAISQRRPLDAIALAERAVQIRESGAPAGQVAESRAVLAKALWVAPAGQGRDHRRALTLAHQARLAFRGAQGWDRELAEVEAFLAKHESRRKLDGAQR